MAVVSVIIVVGIIWTIVVVKRYIDYTVNNYQILYRTKEKEEYRYSPLVEERAKELFFYSKFRVGLIKCAEDGKYKVESVEKAGRDIKVKLFLYGMD